MERIICLVIGYICGLFQTGYIIGKVHKTDIREHGSGNAGTTNAFRTFGKKAGALTLLGDCLIVLYLLMKKFLFGPIIGVMEKRKAMIDEQFASAEKTTTEANQLKGQYEDALKSAKEESFSIVEQAKDEAKVQADSIVKRANDQAGQILEKARRDISTEQEAAMKAMEGKVAELAMDAASRIMGKKNDEAQDMSLYDQFLEGAGDPHDRDVH